MMLYKVLLVVLTVFSVVVMVLSITVVTVLSVAVTIDHCSPARLVQGISTVGSSL